MMINGFCPVATSPTRLVLLVCLAAILAGCSTTGMVEPSSPGHGELEAASLPGDASRALIGYYSGIADPEKGLFEMTPMRTVATHFNMVYLLNFQSGITYKFIPEESNVGQRLLTVAVTIKNPYAGAPKFSGLDTRGILITGASRQIGIDLWASGKINPQLLNADGWTRWWNPNEFSNPGYFGYIDGWLGAFDFGAYDAVLNGYKMFADSLSETEEELYAAGEPALDADTGRAVFRSAKLTRRYTIQFPAGESHFNYAVDVSWAEPVKWPPEIPDDFPPDANCAEAWYVRCDIVQNTLEYDAWTGPSGGIILQVYVHDWQGRILGQAAPQVASINIHSIDLFGSYIAHPGLIFDNGKKAIYQINLQNECVPTGPGTKWVGIEVISSVGSYNQVGKAAPSAALAAYQLVPIEVAGSEPALIKKFGIHAFVLRKNDGTDPAVSDAQLERDVNWANAFYNHYGFGVEIAEKSYIDSSLFYILDIYYADYLNEAEKDLSGLLNVYYVKSFVGTNWLGFAYIPCYYSECFASSTYIFMSADATLNDPETLAHEMGHNIGLLADEYLLDSLPNCTEVVASQGCPVSSHFFCSELDNVPYNLMYFALGTNGQPQDYYIGDDDIGMSSPTIDSQAENIAYFHTHYPYNFKDMQNE